MPVFECSYYFNRKPVEHFLGFLDELTLDDLTAVAGKVLSSKLTMACLGDGTLLFLGLFLIFTFK